MDRVKWSALARRWVPDRKGISPVAVSAAGHGTGARRPGDREASETARASLSAAFFRVQLDRPEKTPGNQLIRPGRSNICVWRMRATRQLVIFSAPNEASHLSNHKN
jgi:hypothetical protein